MRGKLITIEGCEGAGKSTQAERLVDLFTRLRLPFVFTREPGGTAIAETIRRVILEKSDEKMSDRAELFLYAAARSQHVETLIRPALIAGKTVICDRFCDSTLAYQGYARGISLDLVRSVNTSAADGLMPDLTLFLDIEPAKSFARKGGADAGDRIENETLAFHERVYAGYRAIAAAEPRRFIPIPAEGVTPEQIFSSICAVLSARGIIPGGDGQ